MKSRFTALFFLSALACAACAALVAMLMITHPPVVHMSKEMAYEQLSLVGLGLFVMLLLIASLIVLMRLRRRVKQIHQVLAKYSHAHFDERVLNVASRDDLGVLEYRVNRLLDTLDVFVRQEHAAVNETTDGEYYQSITTTPLMHSLNESRNQVAVSQAEAILVRDIDGMSGSDDVVIVPVVDDFGEEAGEDESDIETLEIASEGDDVLSSELDDFAFESESESEEGESSVLPAMIEEGTLPEEAIAFDDAPDEVEAAPVQRDAQDELEDVTESFLASVQKFSALSGYIRDALEKFYTQVRDYREESDARVEAADGARGAAASELLVMREQLKKTSADQAKMKASLLSALNDMPRDDAEVWEDDADDAQGDEGQGSDNAESVLRKGIAQVAVMAKQVRMYTLGAIAQAEKQEGDAEGFKQAAEEIRTLASESADAAKEMEEALAQLKDSNNKAQAELLEKAEGAKQERVAIQGVADKLRESLEAMTELTVPESANDSTNESDVAQSSVPLKDMDEMMSVLRAATDAMKDEAKELEGQLVPEEKEEAA